ncbi:MAG: hypothetical protein FJ403_04345 [Verrucomicrobia bacterium]|nr:hypothetical protein [Verrucomicrobiota bacterium]
MVRILFDENIDRRIIGGLRRRISGLDSLTVQEAGLRRRLDVEILAFAASEERVVITHDVNTLIKDAKERISAELPTLGVFIVPAQMPIGAAIEELHFALAASNPEDFYGTLTYVPL